MGDRLSEPPLERIDNDLLAWSRLRRKAMRDGSTVDLIESGLRLDTLLDERLEHMK